MSALSTFDKAELMTRLVECQHEQGGFRQKWVMREIEKRESADLMLFRFFDDS
jgi:hypothetical protein